MKSHQIVRAGVGRTFQTATVFEELTVLQNLDIAGGVHRQRLAACCWPDAASRRTSRRPWRRSGSRTCGTAPPGSSPTDRSSGSRSACCSSRTPR